MNDTAIILAAFGTSTEARATYDFFEAGVRQRFPQHDIFWAFTSRMLKRKMAEQGLVLLSPEELLQELPERGYAKAVMQSLHIVPGMEYEKTVAAAKHAPLPVSIGMPLLSSKSDCDLTLAAFADEITDTEGCISVIVGHGTPHAKAQNMYRLFHESLRQRYQSNVYLSMVEGNPPWEEVAHAIRQNSIKHISFLPLMFVAGDHIANDVLGDRDSWAAQLEGYAILRQARGLGFNPHMQRIYFQHLQEALDRV